VFGVGTTNSYYANGHLDHRISILHERLSAGHEVEIDVFSQQSDVTYATYSSSWKVNTKVNLAFTLSYQERPPIGGPGWHWPSGSTIC